MSVGAPGSHPLLRHGSRLATTVEKQAEHSRTRYEPLAEIHTVEGLAGAAATILRCLCRVGFPLGGRALPARGMRESGQHPARCCHASPHTLNLPVGFRLAGF